MFVVLGVKDLRHNGVGCGYTMVFQRVWHLRFEYVTGLIILINLVLVGVELEMGLSTPGFYELLGRWARQCGFVMFYVLFCFRCFLVEQTWEQCTIIYNYHYYAAFMSHESLRICAIFAILMKEAKQNCIQTFPRKAMISQENLWSNRRKKTADSPPRNECCLGMEIGKESKNIKRGLGFLASHPECKILVL